MERRGSAPRSERGDDRPETTFRQSRRKEFFQHLYESPYSSTWFCIPCFLGLLTPRGNNLLCLDPVFQIPTIYFINPNNGSPLVVLVCTCIPFCDNLPLCRLGFRDASST